MMTANPANSDTPCTGLVNDAVCLSADATEPAIESAATCQVKSPMSR